MEQTEKNEKKHKEPPPIREVPSSPLRKTLKCFWCFRTFEYGVESMNLFLPFQADQGWVVSCPNCKHQNAIAYDEWPELDAVGREESRRHYLFHASQIMNIVRISKEEKRAANSTHQFF